MSSYGVTSEGFLVKPFEQIKDDVAGRLRSGIASGLNLTSESEFGVAYLIFCEFLSQQWELGEGVYNSLDPDAAIDQALDRICALTGTLRDDATRSTVTVDVTTDQAVDVDPGNFVTSVDGNPDATFENVGSITTAGADTVSVEFQAQDTGPVEALAGTLTEIETPTTGITGVTNPLDAELGTDIESNEDLRVSRENELDAQGAGTVDSIRSQLLDVTDVEDAVVFQNTGDAVDGGGRPPHSVHAVVLGGASADIAQAIWDAVGGGIETHGSQSDTATDNRGKDQTVNWDNATETDIYLEMDVDIIADDYPADGDTQLAELLVANGDALSMGADVILERLQQGVFGVSGVYDITGFRMGTAPSPAGTSNLAIDDTEIARFDTSRVVIATNPVTP